MKQIWTDAQLGRFAKGGIENYSARTGFVANNYAGTVKFGKGLVRIATPVTEGATEVVTFGDPTGSAVFMGFAAYSEEATNYTRYTAAGSQVEGPIGNRAVYAAAYKAGDVVKLVDLGSIIVKIDASASAGVKEGDRLVLLKGGDIAPLSSITENPAGTDVALVLDAIAESDGNAGENIGIWLYSGTAKEIKY